MDVGGLMRTASYALPLTMAQVSASTQSISLALTARPDVAEPAGTTISKLADTVQKTRQQVAQPQKTRQPVTSPQTTQPQTAPPPASSAPLRTLATSESLVGASSKRTLDAYF